MFGRERVDQRQRRFERRHDNDCAVVAPRRTGDLATWQGAKLKGDRAFDLFSHNGAVGDQNSLGTGVMLGLGQKICGDPVRIAVAIGDNEHFGRSGNGVDADLAEHNSFGGRDVRVPRPDDLGDRGNGFCSEGESGNGLSAADAKDFVDAGELGRRQNQRVEVAVGRRHRHDQPRHAGDLGRHRVHEH